MNTKQVCAGQTGKFRQEIKFSCILDMVRCALLANAFGLSERPHKLHWQFYAVLWSWASHWITLAGPLASGTIYCSHVGISGWALN